MASPVFNALLGTLFTWGVTAAGAALVFAFPTDNKSLEFQQKLLDGSLGFAAGVMLAASYFSLLAPAVEMAEETYGAAFSFIPAVVGFLSGAGFVFLGDRMGPTDVMTSMMMSGDTTGGRSGVSSGNQKKHDDLLGPGSASPSAVGRGGIDGGPMDPSGLRRRVKGDVEASSGSPRAAAPSFDSVKDAEAKATAKKQSLRRVMLLIFAVTIHNFPEGLAVGVGFGAVGSSPSATSASAWALAIGIGLQNFPEGLAVSVPLHRAGMSKMRAFFYGQLSGMVEPIAGLLGASAVTLMSALLPYSLAFAAGAMVFVVMDSLVPEAHASSNATLATWGAMVGFAVMMGMDVALG